MSSLPLLDGPRLGPLSSRPPQGVAVLLHGYSMSGDEMIQLAEQFRLSLPDLAFVAPHGPKALPGGGRAWFGLTRMDSGEFWSGAVATRPLLDHFLDTERDRLEITDDRIVLVGFSQGAVLALHVALRRPSAPGAVVGYAGLLAGPEHLGEIKVRPPVTLILGDRDPFVSLDTMNAGAAALKKAGVPVTTSVSPGVGHAVGPPGLRAGVEAIQEVRSFRTALGL